MNDSGSMPGSGSPFKPTVKDSMKIQSQIGNKGFKTGHQQGQKQPASTRIIRAVASSTAIETGQSISELETRLQAQDSKYQQLALATI